MKGYLSLLVFTIVSITALVVSCNKEQYNYLDKTKDREEIIATENKLEKAYNMYLGLFSNKVQARKEPSAVYRSQELISVPIWPRRGDEYWMYVCWLQEDRPEDLLSQEVWNFKKKDRETLELKMFDIPDKGDYVDDWRKKDPLNNLHPDELIYREGCTATIKREGKDRFVITGVPCRRNLSDMIKYVEIHGVMTPDSIVLYNKMLDIDQHEVFSYKKGLHFERQPKIFPKYLDDE